MVTRPRRMRMRAAAALVMVGGLALAGCAGEPERPLSLFEEGALDRFEVDGQQVEADHTVMCLWASSESGGVSIVPTNEGDPDAVELQIGFDRDTGELSELAIRTDDEWVLWSEGDPGELTLDGPRFAVDAVVTADGATLAVLVEGSCDTDFDTVVG